MTKDDTKGLGVIMIIGINRDMDVAEAALAPLGLHLFSVARSV
ncbi:MAG: hypothetical protein QF828_02470 [Pseudomonadales bacterium]|jgi:PhoPQ-activated pathogenicity-related protein|nr:hypothetical protein [Pseudomonadales bacterium]|tara:strand:+ start:518 stop:646 length:129 start_codon:yes stop_codon:yes gene_type:complete